MKIKAESAGVYPRRISPVGIRKPKMFTRQDSIVPANGAGDNKGVDFDQGVQP